MKKVISTILGILFVIIVICGVFVCTYVFNEPSHEKNTDSRQLILGYWTDEDDDIRFYFDQGGEFKIVKASEESHIYAQGYFKINEDAGKIKLMIMPNKERDASFDMGEKLKMFTEITYRNLDSEEPNYNKGWTFLTDSQRKEIMEAPSSCKFIMSNADETVYNCERTRTVREFNGDEQSEKRMDQGGFK